MYACQTGYRQEPYAGSFQTALAGIPGCNKWSNVPDDYDVSLYTDSYYTFFKAIGRVKNYCPWWLYNGPSSANFVSAPQQPRPVITGINYPGMSYASPYEYSYTVINNFCYLCSTVTKRTDLQYPPGYYQSGPCTNQCYEHKNDQSITTINGVTYKAFCTNPLASASKPLDYDSFRAILKDSYRAVPYYTTVPTTVAEDIAATPQYDYRPADPIMSDINAQDAKLTRTQAQVMAIQTTNATTGSVQGRQCMCSGTQYMDLLNKNCVTLCPAATYADSATRTCQPCRANKTSPEGSTSSAQCVCSYATPYWTGFSCMQQLNPSAVVTGSGFTTRYENKYTIHEFTQSGSFTLLSPTIAKLLLVGGGAGGSSDGYPGGGGTVTNVNNQSLSGGTYNVVVGASGGPNSSGGNTSLTGPGTNFTANGGTVLTSLTSLTSFRFINLGESTILYCACADSACTPPPPSTSTSTTAASGSVTADIAAAPISAADAALFAAAPGDSPPSSGTIAYTTYVQTNFI
jgi:hypothetical protein